MILGMSVLVFVHVVISLVGILAGFAVVFGLMTANRMDSWTVVFLTTTVLTSLTGYVLPAQHVMPSHVVGAISLVVLALAIYARYPHRMAGGWRTAYVISAVTAFYLNFFVLVAQLFAKVPALKALAPTQSEPPFAVTQGLVLLIFVILGVLGTLKFRKAQLHSV